MAQQTDTRTYEVFLARPREARFDWRTAEALGALDLRVKLAADREHVEAVVKAIGEDRLEGRRLEDGAWVGAVPAARVRAVLHEVGLQLPPDVEDLGSGTWYVVAAEA